MRTLRGTHPGGISRKENLNVKKVKKEAALLSFWPDTLGFYAALFWQRMAGYSALN